MSGDRHLRAVGGAGEEAFAGAETPDPTPLTPQQQRELRRAKRAALWVGLILPLVLTAAATTVLIVWLPRLPDPMATHWSGSGAPDGFMPPAAGIAVFAGLGIGMSALLGLLGVFGGKATAPVWSGMNRFLAATSLGVVTLVMVLAVLSARIQLDLADARDAPGIGGVMAIGFAAAIVGGGAGFLVQPSLRIESSRRNVLRPLELGENERAVWVGEIRPSRAFAWVLGTTLVVTSATMLWLVLLGGPGWWIPVGVVVLMLVLAVTCSWFRVRVDEHGIEARSLAGWPRFSVPAEDVASVEAREINPLGEWGGWGTRWVPGTGFGIVMRTGEGILITRRDGRLFAVTVDDAATGAALLEAVAARAAGERESNVGGDG
jgi:hypothetical protein